MSQTFKAVSVLVGTIIGAGILGLPYVIMHSGFFIGAIILIFVALLMILITLYLGEIGLRTRKAHQLTGYAEKYLGKKGKIFMFVTFAFGIYSALLAYLIGEGNSISFLLTGTTNYVLASGIAFWILLSALAYFGLKALEEGEELGVILIFGIIILITVIFVSKVNVENLTYIKPEKFFFPFGVVMFAFLGYSAIPEIERILVKHKNLTKRSIVLSYLYALLVYIIFVAIVLGAKGKETPELATLALGRPFVFLGMLTMFTAYLSLSIALIDTLKLDFNISRKRAWFYVIFMPLVLFIILTLFKSATFVKVLGIGGSISGFLISLIVLVMINKAKKYGERKPEYSIPYSKILAFIIILILAIGTILEIIRFL